MKSTAKEKSSKDLLAQLPDREGDITFLIEGYSKGKGGLEVVVNGRYDRAYKFDFFSADIKRCYLWLEQILQNRGCVPTEFSFSDKEIHTGHHYAMGFKSIEVEGVFSRKGDNGESYGTPLKEFGMVYLYDIENDTVANTCLMGKEDFPRRVYSLITYTGSLRLRSKFIENYFLSKDEISLEYKGYHTTARIKKGDLRYYGEVCVFQKGKMQKTGWEYAANNFGELQCRFKSEVDEIISQKEERESNQAWHEAVDVSSLVPFFCLNAHKLEEKILSGTFDQSVLEKVTGIDIDVPVTYVIKCWDYLLQGHILEFFLYRIQQEEGDDPGEFNFERTPKEAKEEIGKIKELLKLHFGIDVDSISFDLCDVLHSVEYDFDDDFYDISEWLLDYIPYRYDDIPRNGIVSLLEFTYSLMLESQENSCELSTVI